MGRRRRVIAAVLGLGSIVVREFRTVSAVTPVIAREALSPSPVPAGVPSRAVSVPMLLLPDGKEVRVGEQLDADGVAVAPACMRSGRKRWTARRKVSGMTRFYEYAGDDSCWCSSRSSRRRAADRGDLPAVSLGDERRSVQNARTPRPRHSRG